MGCDCGKPKCDGHCGVSPAVLQINNPSECVLFHKVEVPEAMGTSTDNPPQPGAYKNVLLVYKADGAAYLYSSDGMPTLISGTGGGEGTTDYRHLTNKPSIEGHTLVGDSSLTDIGVTGAINSALESYTPTSGFAEVAFSGSYTNLTDKPDIPPGPHIFYMEYPLIGDAAPIYHDHNKTDPVTLAQFTDAIASGPVQIYVEHDTSTFRIYYVDHIDAFIPDPPEYIGTLYANFGLRDPYGLGVRYFSWYEGDLAPTYDSYDANQSDWNESNSTNSSYIKNKPNLATVATSGSYNDLSDKPTIPEEMVVLSYGSSTWQNFIDAYADNRVVYCRASSATNPATGSQNRLAFMAYVNDATNPTEVEFQYYRSVSSKTAAQQCDQVFIYTLTPTNGGTWAVATREVAAKVVAGTNMTSSYSSGTITLNATIPTPTVFNMTYDTTATTWTDTDVGVTLQESSYGTFPAILEQIQTFAVPTPVFTNASTGSTLDAEGLYNLLETGEDVVLNGVPVSVRSEWINGTTTFTVGNIVCDGVRLTKVGPLHIEDTDPGTGDITFSVDMMTYSATVSSNAVGMTTPTLLPFAIRVYKRVTFNVNVGPDPQTEYAFEIQGTSYSRMDSPT